MEKPAYLAGFFFADSSAGFVLSSGLGLTFGCGGVDNIRLSTSSIGGERVSSWGGCLLLDISEDYHLAMDDLQPFESPRALIDAAKEHLAHFNEGCEVFVRDCPRRIVKEFDAKNAQDVFKLKFGEGIPRKLRTKAGDILSNLRHSLDHAACDGALMLGAKSIKAIHFPFAKDATHFTQMVAKNCAGMREDLRDFLASFNAYYGGDDLLFALNDLTNPAKHQRILAIARKAKGILLDSDGLFLQGPGTIGSKLWNDARNEIEVVRVAHSPHSNVKFDVAIEIVLGPAAVVGGQNARGVFLEFANKVERIVSAIEAETRRLKAARP